MPALLDLPSITDAAEFHLARWREVCADPYVLKAPGRVETNRFGETLMMPPPGFSHSHRQFEIAHALKLNLMGGTTLTECAVLTADGVKGVDVAWISATRLCTALKDDVLTVAPEICVEVISPSNTLDAMEEKRALYFEAGADEVWLCDKDGALHIFLKSSPGEEAAASVVCPRMPMSV